MSQHDDLPYLKHILDAITDIENSTGKSKKDFLKNKELKDATVRRLEIIGEAAKNISPSLKSKYPLVEWKKIAGTRDIVIHAYFRVDLDVVWNIAKKDVPELKRQIRKISESLGEK